MILKNGYIRYRVLCAEEGFDAQGYPVAESGGWSQEIPCQYRVVNGHEFLRDEDGNVRRSRVLTVLVSAESCIIGEEFVLATEGDDSDIVMVAEGAISGLMGVEEGAERYSTHILLTGADGESVGEYQVTRRVDLAVVGLTKLEAQWV